MSFDLTKTVGEVALENPSATRVFEKCKIDYCCGGERTLGAACRDAGADVDEVLVMLEGAAREQSGGDAAKDFQAMTLAEVIRHILDTHHAYARREMKHIAPLVERVFAAHGDRHEELGRVRALFLELCADIEPHMMKEERILFPYILALEESARRKSAPPFAPFGSVENPIRMMLHEHDTAGQVLRELRAASNDYFVPEDVCTSYQLLFRALEDFEQDLHRHVHLENNLLFPRALELEGAARSI
ncbi:MAG TPA: iron-sulfur cluster repair di-iron protein [Pyrinomonadaceae bacterium]|nr:iron-sulfur cluster repair di-iron protein [Pyrinomonadaceae bacterium]